MISVYSCVFWRNFSQESDFGGVSGIPVFGRYHRIFLRKSCGTGIPVFARDSFGFLWIPAGFVFLPNFGTTNVGFLLSKISTKLEI